MELSATITVPKLGELLLGNAKVAHNRCVKTSVREELERHYQRRLPGHFTGPAHARYGYKERQLHYRIVKQKKYGRSIDLVQTGASKKSILSGGKISVGGQGDTVKGTLTTRFSFDQRVAEGRARRSKRGAPPRPRKKPNVRIADMKSEVRRFTADETREVSAGIRKRYVRLVKSTTGSRQRVKV